MPSVPSVPSLLRARFLQRSQSFNSNRPTADHAPAAPVELFARTRHHILVVGSVLVVNRETATGWSTVNGAENVSVLSIWIV